MSMLLTGGCGYIGSYLAERLNMKGYNVAILDRERRGNQPNYYRADLNDYHSLERVFSVVKPELVVHLAAMVSRRECEETPTLAISTNVTGTYNVCSLCLKHDARIIYSGSSEEWGTAYQNGTVDEDTPFGTPTGMYSMTKRMAEEIVQHASTFKGLLATTTRIFMLYGPREESSDYRSAVARFFHWALNNQALQVHKNTERSWCYITDAIDVLERIIERKQESNYEVYNIGKHDPIATETLAKKIIEISQSKSKIEMVQPDPTIIPIKRGSFEKAKRILGWEAKVTLDEGLKKVKEYLQSNDTGVYK